MEFAERARLMADGDHAIPPPPHERFNVSVFLEWNLSDLFQGFRSCKMRAAEMDACGCEQSPLSSLRLILFRETLETPETKQE